MGETSTFLGSITCEMLTQLKVLRAKILSGKFLPADGSCDLPSTVPLQELNIYGSYIYDNLPWKLFEAAKNLKTFVVSTITFGEIPEKVVV